jgi:hypothetical protein
MEADTATTGAEPYQIYGVALVLKTSVRFEMLRELAYTTKSRNVEPLPPRPS